MQKEAMRRISVESSSINSIGHNFLTRNMEIEFNGGGIYRYKKVPRHVFKNMMNADSKGKFFWSDVRFNYPFKKYRNKNGEKVNDDWRILKRKEENSMDKNTDNSISQAITFITDEWDIKLEEIKK